MRGGLPAEYRICHVHLWEPCILGCVNGIHCARTVYTAHMAARKCEASRLTSACHISTQMFGDWGYFKFVSVVAAATYPQIASVEPQDEREAPILVLFFVWQ
jgi:hypothetical protein